jgi:hypothetical protein
VARGIGAREDGRMLRQTLTTLTVALALGLTLTTAAASAATISISGPTTGTQFDDLPLKVGVDPAGLPTETQSYLAIYATTGACPANASVAPVNPDFGRFITTADGPVVFDFPYDMRTAGSITLCGFLSANSTSPDVFASTTYAITVKPADTRQNPTVTAAWGRAANGKCRVQGDVTPRGTGKVRLQRRVGSSWKTVKSVAIKGTKYVTTFPAKNGQRYRVSYAGSTDLFPAVSLTHRISKRSKFVC